MRRKAARRDVYLALDSEREYQHKKWGSETHTVTEYLLYMEHSLFLARAMASSLSMSDEANKRKVLDCVRKVTALGVVCMEDEGAPRREF